MFRPKDHERIPEDLLNIKKWLLVWPSKHTTLSSCCWGKINHSGDILSPSNILTLSPINGRRTLLQYCPAMNECCNSCNEWLHEYPAILSTQILKSVSLMLGSEQTNMELEQIVKHLKEDLEDSQNVIETMLTDARDVSKVVKKLKLLL